jgi:hypothetical protein
VRKETEKFQSQSFNSYQPSVIWQCQVFLRPHCRACVYVHTTYTQVRIKTFVQGTARTAAHLAPRAKKVEVHRQGCLCHHQPSIQVQKDRGAPDGRVLHALVVGGTAALRHRRDPPFPLSCWSPIISVCLRSSRR